MLQLNSVMIGSSNPKKLIDFYEKILEKKPEMVEGEWAGWQLGDVFFSVGKHSEVSGKSKQPGRMIFNLETSNVKGEFARVSSLGATVIKELYNMGGGEMATFADPDGNYFQLMSPWKG